MKLNRDERDYYVQEITVEPPLGGTWQASFDAGETWLDGTETDQGWAWLVAGPDFVGADVGMDDADTAAVITTTMRPRLRNADNPILDVEYGTTIRLVP